jgi:oxygen-independent coproporphyrinogen-3 oxidase
MDDEIKTKYMKALRNELIYRLGLLGIGSAARKLPGSENNNGRCHDDNPYIIDTVFIGGGTPSVLSGAENALLADILSEQGRNGVPADKSADTSSGTSVPPSPQGEGFLEKAGYFAQGESTEITIEANPGTLTREKLEGYRRMGINRLSMGVQSFDDEILKKLGRIHNAEMVYNNFSLARECGFNNINLDLMFGLPGQSMETWEKTLNEAINLGAEHISFYSLQLEENTPFFKDFEAGSLELPSDELDREMYHRAIAILKEAGYHHYEISNAAKISANTIKNCDLQNIYYCKHNYKYWSMEEYLGVGLGASSFLGGARFKNTDDLAEYIGIWGNIIDATDDSKCVDIRNISDSGCAIRFSGAQENKGRVQNNNAEEPDSTMELMKKGTVEWHDNKFHDFVSEFVFTGLRKTEGIDLNEFEERYGVGFFEYFESQKAYVDFCIRQGYMDTSSGTDVPPSPRGEGFLTGDHPDSLLAGGRLRLTEKGIDISNSIMAEFV